MFRATVHLNAEIAGHPFLVPTTFTAKAPTAKEAAGKAALAFIADLEGQAPSEIKGHLNGEVKGHPVSVENPGHLDLIFTDLEDLREDDVAMVWVEPV